MARATILGGLCILIGACLGWMLKPGSSVTAPVQTEEKQTQVQVVERVRTVVKTVKPDGTVIVKEVDKDVSKSKSEASKKTVVKPLPKSEYRVGVQTGIDLKPTVTAGRRLFGSVWLDSSFKPSSKDVTIGLSYEF